ncbi:MAG: hypothetical protein EOO34_00350 [Cyanobacteriota bacterium]|nr:MAG: hypothetical protein EOO34_00350 [Cyanobacteriota bacterium]
MNNKSSICQSIKNKILLHLLTFAYHLISPSNITFGYVKHHLWLCQASPLVMSSITFGYVKRLEGDVRSDVKVNK